MLVSKLNSLKNAGAEFAAITANTPHLLFDPVKERSPLPLISIVEATCKETVKRGLKKPGLFGTGFTMAATFYQEVFDRYGIPLVVPDPEDQRS
jgi:aspartate racemase